MRKIIGFVIAILVMLNATGQEKKDLAISLSAGVLNSPYYNNAHSRGFFGFGFDYHVSRRHVLSASYLAGKHNYLDNILSNTTY